MKKTDLKKAFNLKSLRKAAVWSGAILGGMALAYVTGGLAFSASTVLLTTVGLSKGVSSVIGGATAFGTALLAGGGTMCLTVNKLDPKLCNHKQDKQKNTIV